MYRIDREKVFWRYVEGETILLNIDTGMYYTLTGVGSAAWDLIAAAKKDDEIVRQLTARYDVDAATARKDLQSLLGTLEREKLIEKRGPDGKR